MTKYYESVAGRRNVRLIRVALSEMDERIETAFQLVQDDLGTGPGNQESLVFSFAASPMWIVNHNLGRNVQCEVLSNGGARIGVEVRQVSDNQLRVYFDVPIAGKVLIR